MPRLKDGIFAQVSCKILHGQNFNRLSEADQGFYLKLWTLAVRERTACLLGSVYGVNYAAFELHVDYRRGKRALAKIAQEKLIKLFPDETITIIGIEECHKKFTWKPVPEMYR
jgi:hypothetical protein